MKRTRFNWAFWLLVSIATQPLLLGRSMAVPLDEEGSINLGMRAYTNIRLHTTQSDSVRPNGSSGATFPYNGAFHLQQNRYFVELKWQQDLLKAAGKWLPASLSTLRYQVTYRGEYEGIYDFGPGEFRNGLESRQEIEEALRRGGVTEDVIAQNAGDINLRNRRRLRNIAVDRNRVFQFFLDYEQGPLFVRIGRQNLAWGETDVFRLLDNINPIDNSFGGFFIELDERRVPLDMLRASLQLGSYGPIDQAFIEGYAAYDDEVALDPGAASGSAFSSPLGPATRTIVADTIDNPRSLKNLRGGVRLVFNAADVTFTFAHYYTIFDTPAVRFRSPTAEDSQIVVPGITTLIADTYGPRVQVTGASMTTAVPRFKGVLRGEFAFNRAEALFRFATAEAYPGKGRTDPAFLTEIAIPVLTGQFDTVSRKDTLNFALGWDMNQYVRFINPAQTLFFTTQFFYRRIIDHDRLQALPVPDANVDLARVIPVRGNQYLQTFRVDTTYNVHLPGTGATVQVTPSYSMFYDWVGALLFQPGIRVVRDPWRVVMDYTMINSGVFRGTGIGLVRDKDNIRFQLEYIL